MSTPEAPPPEHERTLAGPPEAVQGDFPVDEVLAEVAEEVDAFEEILDVEPLDHPRRMVLVHAHPDDETIGTGATMAKYAAEHALVTLVTCTLGEEGEVLVPELEHLAADKDDALGQHRVNELAAACEALGVEDHRFLGGAGRWRDSGMMGLETNNRPNCFWQADLDEATLDLVRVFREIRPQVVVTYDENGAYGHPDHIQAHNVTVRAFDASGDSTYHPEVGEPWQPAKLYYTAISKSWLQQGIDAFHEEGSDTGFFEGVTNAEDLPMGVPDEQITTQIDGSEQFSAKIAAMRAHATQIAVGGMFYALADRVGQKNFATEQYVLVRGDRGPGNGPEGREDDLFAGVLGAS
jgi:N-acetyl-1-D-myo-inositol-2-amino-2-deoxy-alpha-D-glucopyranoside deacetylase